MCPYYTHPFADVVQVEESAGCDTDLSNVDGCRFGTLSQSQMDIGSLQLKNVQYNVLLYTTGYLFQTKH